MTRTQTLSMPALLEIVTSSNSESLHLLCLHIVQDDNHCIPGLDMFEKQKLCHKYLANIKMNPCYTSILQHLCPEITGLSLIFVSDIAAMKLP